MSIVPAWHGWLWIRDAIRIFFRRPLLWMLLVLAYLAAMTIIGAVPMLGLVLGLGAVPAFSVSFMNVAREIDRGVAPAPALLVSGFRRNTRSMITLGGIYFVGCALVLGLTTLIDDGVMLDALRGRRRADFESSMLIAAVFYSPVMAAFWFAPALAYSNGLAPAKALFFSFVATCRNWRAMLFYGAMLAALMVLIGALLIFSARLAGGGTEAAPGGSAFGLLVLPVLLALSAILFASWYTSFKDVFGTGSDDPPRPGAR